MIKRNINQILIIIAMAINMLNFEFSEFNIESKKTLLFLAASIFFIVSIIKIFINEIKNNKNTIL